MKITDPKTGKNLLKMKKLPDFEPSFCPFCELLFMEDSNSYNKTIRKNTDTIKFLCHKCKKNFDETTYTHEVKKKTNYTFSSSYKNDLSPEEFIKDKILKLHKEGYVQRDIIKLTKFPKSLVENYTKLPKKVLEIISIEKFKKEYLNFTKDMKKEDEVKSAIEFGCTVRQIREICRVGNKTIAEAREYKGNVFLRKNKIEIVKEKVRIIKLSEKI